MIQKAIEVLQNNGVIIFPSDTVWGVGCLLNDIAIKKLYKIKNREPQKPTGIYVKDLNMAQMYSEFNSEAMELAQLYWPGALSIVVKAKDNLSPLVKGETQNVSLRIPNHPLLLELLDQLNQPLVQTSANFAGENPPYLKKEINPDFMSQVDFLLDGESLGQKPSTIVDATKSPFEVLRLGPIELQ